MWTAVMEEQVLKHTEPRPWWWVTITTMVLIANRTEALRCPGTVWFLLTTTLQQTLSLSHFIDPKAEAHNTAKATRD